MGYHKNGIHMPDDMADFVNDATKFSIYPSPETLDAAGWIGSAQLPPIDCLPPILKNAVIAITQIVRVPQAMALGSVLLAVSQAGQGLYNIKHPNLGEEVPLSLFLLSIAVSGDRKTGSDKQALKGLKDYQNQLEDLYRNEIKAYKLDSKAYKVAMRQASNNKGRAAIKTAMAMCGDEPEPPLLPRFILDDVTSQGVLKHLLQSRAAIAISSDEGAKIFGGYSFKESEGATSAYFSKWWDGEISSPNRVGENYGNLKGRRITAHLMIQPVFAGGIFNNPVFREQGILGRMLVCFADSLAGTRFNIHPDTKQRYKPPKETKPNLEAFHSFITSLCAKPLPVVEGTRQELTPECLVLDKEAAILLDEFHDENEKEIGQSGLYSHIKPFCNKAGEHALRFAGLFHMVHGYDAQTEVSAKILFHAIQLVRFYRSEQSRMAEYSDEVREAENSIRLAKWILKTKQQKDIDPQNFVINGRDLQRKKVVLDTKARNASLDELERLGWLFHHETRQVVNGKLVGRKGRSYQVNPNLTDDCLITSPKKTQPT